MSLVILTSPHKRFRQNIKYPQTESITHLIASILALRGRAILALKEVLAVLIHLKLLNDNLGGVNANGDGGTYQRLNK
ncbi:hypothetical protein BC936DRAFT_149725 [Jimgerdemannia flammicorona]|uniref:Uncharacterized protein n=2 Tax=Jimgerdemannia flammicorona TaxID=994334 RepID=A0A433QJA1_9FUNG|nr:hypothetical protein BC936DRAFT_149725 [Jimgerdemannia flammicorona]RUS29851.1 hypothetical protein BC938DRAFT_480149 [Jimgerdemannia flammicorona]